MVKLFDLVKVNVPTAGTGDIAFGAPFSAGFFTPDEAGAVDGDQPRYVIVDGNDVELGIGLIKSSVSEMERTVVRSRIGGVAGASKINLSGTAFLAFTAAAEDILTPDVFSVMPWYAIPPGGYYYADTSVAGASIPPQSHPDLVYIELTAGLDGSGQFNEGKLTGESVSGSAPLTVATAIVDVTGSPIDGETVHLINTEEAILRPRVSGVGSLQQDQGQKIDGVLGFARMGGGEAILTSGSGVFSRTPAGGVSSGRSSAAAGVTLSSDTANFDSSTTTRAGSETRMKNLGVTAYMRVK